MTARFLYAALTLLALATLPAAGQEAEIVATQKIWDKSNHQGYTDLVRFQNLFYCCFREGESATKGTGTVRMMLSASGDTWIEHVTLSERGRLARTTLIAWSFSLTGKIHLSSQEPYVSFHCSGLGGECKG